MAYRLFRRLQRHAVPALAYGPQDGIDHLACAEPGLVNHEIGIFFIEHRALAVEIPETLPLFDADPARRQIAEAAPYRGVGEFQIDDTPQGFEPRHGFLTVNHGAPRRNHRILGLECGKGLLLQRAKAVISPLGNQLFQEFSVLLLNQKVAVNKTATCLFCQHDADGALAGSRHPDQREAVFSHRVSPDTFPSE